MKRKFTPNFMLIIILLVVGAGLYKLINFKEFSIDKPALAFIYGVVVVVCIGFMYRKPKNDDQ